MSYGAKSSISTAVQITSTSNPVKYGTTLRSDPANTVTLYVGNASTVTAGTADATDGFPLKPGEAIFLPTFFANDVNQLYAICATSTCRVFWTTDAVQAMSLGTVSTGQGTAAALAGAWPMEITDAATGPVFVTPASTGALATNKALVVRPMMGTDGTNTMPTGDATARSVFVEPTDGTNVFKTASATNLAAATAGTNAQLIAPVGNWAVNHGPAVGTLAVASKAAGAAGVRHVATSISGTWASDGTANGAAQNVVLVLRDGATGAGTILGQWTMNRLTTTAADAVNTGQFVLSGLNAFGTAATAMTLEFTGTASNHEFYSATVTGYSVTG